jgi:uncharacterized sulfatase
VLLAMLAALLLTLLLPQINRSWLGRAQPLVLGPADPIATLTRHALLYKSDSRGLYLVVRSQWQLPGRRRRVTRCGWSCSTRRASASIS